MRPGLSSIEGCAPALKGGEERRDVATESLPRSSYSSYGCLLALAGDGERGADAGTGAGRRQSPTSLGSVLSFLLSGERESARL